MNGVSKKLHITGICMSGVLGLAAKAENQLPFALIIAGMFAMYLIGQGFLDWIEKKK